MQSSKLQSMKPSHLPEKIENRIGLMRFLHLAGGYEDVIVIMFFKQLKRCRYGRRCAKKFRKTKKTSIQPGATKIQHAIDEKDTSRKQGADSTK